MTEHLPPHDPLRRCVKCETLTIASTQYRPRRPHLTWNGDTIEEIVTHGPAGGAECLLRTCLDCGWAWLEACADTAPREDQLRCPLCAGELWTTDNGATCIRPNSGGAPGCGAEWDAIGIRRNRQPMDSTG